MPSLKLLIIIQSILFKIKFIPTLVVTNFFLKESTNIPYFNELQAEPTRIK